jgi:hypothetical protein
LLALRFSANPAAFPELNEAKIRKLRMLTIVQLAQENTVRPCVRFGGRMKNTP